MKTVLICPGERADVPLLAAEAPLAVAPVLGQGLVEYWMSHLAGAGVKEVVMLANDRPDEVSAAVGNGERWGLAVEMIAESQELTAAQATEKYGAPAQVMDHFPGLPEHPLFTSYTEWFKAVTTWMPRAKTPDRAAVRQLRDGIWVGLHCHISRTARLCAPCWVGDHVYVGPRAVIGPEAVLEDGAFIEREAEIKNSVIGTATFVGRYVQVINSLASGNTLVSWETGAQHTVPDAFLLCSVRLQLPKAKSVSLLERMTGWLTPMKEPEPGNYQALLVKEEANPNFVPVRQTQSP